MSRCVYKLGQEFDCLFCFLVVYVHVSFGDVSRVVGLWKSVCFQNGMAPIFWKVRCRMLTGSLPVSRMMAGWL